MTSIEWTDESWNPIRAYSAKNPKQIGWHCEKVSPGCSRCYAEAMNRRLGTRRPYIPRDLGVSPGVKLYVDRDVLFRPLRWKKPRRIFVCSMTDLFGRFVEEDWIDQVFAIAAICYWHTFQILTKRPERAREWFADWGHNWERREFVAAVAEALTDDKGERLRIWDPRGPERHRYPRPDLPGARIEIRRAWPGWPLPNVWLGTSAETQDLWNERVRALLDVPAAVRWVSAEPLLEEVVPRLCRLCGNVTHYCHADPDDPSARIDWVVVGGESGPRARPMDINWARRIVEHCRPRGTPVFVKQLGARPYQTKDADVQLGTDGALATIFDRAAVRSRQREGWTLTHTPDGRSRYVRPVELEDSKGGDPEEWPFDLRVRQWPKEGAA